MSKYRIVKIGDVCTLKSGKSISKDLELENGKIPYIKVSDMNIKENNRHIVTSTKFVDDNINSNNIFPKGTVIFPKRGGAIGTNKKRLTDCEICADLNIMGVIPNDEVLPKYLFFYFNTLDLSTLSNGSSVPQINNGDIAPIQMPLPDINTQERIVSILERAEDAICKREESNRLLDEYLKSVFVDMFGDPIGNSKGWKKKKMNDVAPVVNYKGDFNEEKIWLLNLDMVESNTGNIIDYNYVLKEDIGNSTCTFDTTNVLYSKLRPYLNKVVIPNEIGYATSEMVPLQPLGEILNRYYLTYMLRNKSFVDYISEKVSGAKMPRVTMNDFRDFDVPIPSIELQNEFENLVKQVDKMKLKMENSLEELQNNFNSLMQRAFNGELF